MRLRDRSGILLGLCIAVVVPGGPARGQAGARGDGWLKVENADETKTYKDEAIAGILSEPSVAWLRGSVLPQLAAEVNRPTIERTRRRIHDAFLNEKSFGATALESGNRVAVDAMRKLADSDDLPPIVRVNAVLLIGDLRAKNGAPWPATLEPLAAAAANTKLPIAVRIAAISGLARHAGSAEFGKAGGQKVADVVVERPSERDRDGADWLVSRALELMPAAFPQVAPTTAAAMVKILDDEGRAVDVRVRAAAALGATAGGESRIDAARAIATIRSLAAAALAADVARAENRAAEHALDGAAAATPQPAQVPVQPPVPLPGLPGLSGLPDDRPDRDPKAPYLEPLMVRRDAWRLAQLADAIERDDGRGLARLLDQGGQDAARFLAKSLRAAAQSLDEQRDFAAVKEALERFAAPGGDDTAPAADRPGAPADDGFPDPVGP